MAEQLVTSVQVEKLDADLFRSQMLWTPKTGRGTFGGQLVAHSQEAARQTVPDSLKVHSLHGNFLLPGNSNEPIYYRVVSVRTGKSFATRIVTATQNGNAVYTATVSFHRVEKPGLVHAPSMPVVPGPEFGTSDSFFSLSLRHGVEEGFKKRQALAAERAKMVESLDRQSASQLPITMRFLLPECVDVAHEEGKLKEVVVDEPSRTWIKTDYDGDDPNMHQLIMSFITDFTLLFSAMGPHLSKATQSLGMMCSLDHVVYYHEPVNVNEWFLYEVRSTWADSNRALTHGRIYNSKGQLAMSTVQEGLIRMKPGFRSEVGVTSKL